MSLVVKLAVAMIGLVVVATLSVGSMISVQASRAALPLALKNLGANTGLVASNLESYLSAPQNDVAALSFMPALSEYVARAPTTSNDEEMQDKRLLGEIAGSFSAFLKAKPQYDQIRLIGKADGGREVVRVDRRGPDGSVRTVAADQLQQKSTRQYFQATFAAKSDGFFVSPVDYNREEGVIERPYVPTMRVARRIRIEDAPSDYFVILNLDMRPVFQRLTALATAVGDIHLVDEAGNYLINARAPERIFGFAIGQSFTVQQDWPQIEDLVTRMQPSVIVARDEIGDEQAVAAWPLQLAGERRVTLLQSASPDNLMAATSSAIWTTSIAAAAIGIVIAVLLAAFIASRLGRPIRLITEAVDDAAKDRPVILPLAATGEVGALARAMARYIEREALLRAIVSTSVDAIVTKDLDGVITSWNGAAERLYGYTAEEAIGASLDIIVPPDRREELADIMAQLSAGRMIGAFRTDRVTKAGKSLNVELTVAPIRDASGEIIGASAITRDITKALEDTRNMQKLQAEAAHSSRITAAGQMAATLAHEINQPLTAIINYVQALHRLLLDSGMAEDSRPLVYARKAIVQSNRAGDIVRGVRNFIGNRQAKVARESLNEIVDDGIAVVFVGRDADRIKIRRDYAEDLPEVCVDRTHIQQIVANLTGNAVEAMANVQDRTLTVRTRLVGETVVVSFADTGTGIDGSLAKDLFEPFTTTKPNGMGFGLNISRSLAEAHGGKLSVETSGEGAVFEFTLPIGDAPFGLRH